MRNNFCSDKEYENPNSIRDIILSEIQDNISEDNSFKIDSEDEEEEQPNNSIFYKYKINDFKKVVIIKCLCYKIF